MDDGHIAKRLRIRGHVQGVGYRAWAAAAARGLNGWVRNRADGSVEALVSGEAAAVDAFVAACRRGPPGARVDAIEVEPALGIVARGFVQKPTV